MFDSEFYRFEGGKLQPFSSSVSDVRLAAADSFLVENGAIRSLDAHLERFGNWVRNANPTCLTDLDDFYSVVKLAIPRSGRWFPRIELHLANPNEGLQTDSLFLRLRPAPEQLGDIKLWTLDEPDPRLTPQIKGPDLSLCMQLRRKAQLHGADEAVLLDGGGFVVEGALSSLVWWRGDVLCAPDDSNVWLHSVTRNEVFEIAHSLGLKTRVEHVKPADLVGLEIWALSSLQGIRLVSDWVGLGSPVGPAVYFDKFQKRLRLFARVVG